MMSLGSLCSGAGGLDLAVEQIFGATTVWHAETDPAAAKVLAHRWPAVPNLGDLTECDWSRVEPVGIVCAGWPCQPFSLAGRRKGHADERAIWPAVAGAVRVLRPAVVCLENVPAVVGPELWRVIHSVTEIGYDLRWTCLRASDVGAPHMRERLFIIATAALTGRAAVGESARSASTEETWPISGDGFSHHRGERAIGDGRTSNEFNTWGKYAAAIARWEHVLGRPAPSPTEPNRNGKPRLSPAFSEWMMGWESGWVTEVLGISRNDQLRIIGNGVVPQQAQAALRMLLTVAT